MEEGKNKGREGRRGEGKSLNPKNENSVHAGRQHLVGSNKASVGRPKTVHGPETSNKYLCLKKQHRAIDNLLVYLQGQIAKE